MSVWWICLSNQKIKCTKRKISSLFCYIFSVWTLFVYNWGTTNLTSLFFFTGQQRNCRMTKLKKNKLHPKFDLQPLCKQFSLCAISVYTLFNIQLTLNKWQPILQLLHIVQTQRQALRLAFIPTSNLESPTVIWISFTLRRKWHTKGWHSSST